MMYVKTRSSDIRACDNFPPMKLEAIIPVVTVASAFIWTYRAKHTAEDMRWYDYVTMILGFLGFTIIFDYAVLHYRLYDLADLNTEWNYIIALILAFLLMSCIWIGNWKGKRQGHQS
jgi:hypothetical protein